METQRQKRIAEIIHNDLAEILHDLFRDIVQGVIVTVTKVRVTPDLTEAKIYVSIFPDTERIRLFSYIEKHQKNIRYRLAQRTRHQLRRVPELHFFIDDSIDYMEEIDKALRNETENPIQNPDILPKRKKL